MANALEDLVGAMSVSELASRSGKSVEAIVSWALAGASTGRASASASKNGATARVTPRKTSKKATRRSGNGEVDTRTPAGREEYDARVLDAVRSVGGTAKTGDIAGLTGGTEMQRRVALARLVKARKLTRSGQARATTYSLR